MIYSWPFALKDPEFSFIAKSRAVTPPYKKGLRYFVLLGGLDPGHAGVIKSLSCMGSFSVTPDEPEEVERSGERNVSPERTC